MTVTAIAHAEDFASLLDTYMGEHDRFEGTLVKARVVGISGDSAVVDVGLKSEGRVLLREFPGGRDSVKVGDIIDLFVERYEDRDGGIVLSRERARREETWLRLARASSAKERVQGRLSGRVKGGFTVDIGGVPAFLPGSQVDIRPSREMGPLEGKDLDFYIIKLDRPRGNVVVSRRLVMEEERAGQRDDLLQGLQEGAVFDGMVKNLTEYGAFVDIGGIDGLLHVGDMAWRRVAQPSEVVSIGQQIKVKVIKFDRERSRISLGLKQMTADPWETVSADYPVGARVRARITNVAEYGAFAELGEGIEGLIHVSEMSWIPNGLSPAQIVATTQEVDVVVLDVDTTKRRVSLGLKQASENPFESFSVSHPAGTVVEGEVLAVAEIGLNILLPGGVHGFVASTDLSWDKSAADALALFSPRQVISARVLSVDLAACSIALGIKQTAADPVGDALASVRRDTVVTCVVTEVQTNGVVVKVGEHLTGFIRRAELGRDRADQRPDRFAVGDAIDAKVLAVDAAARRVSLSVRSRERADDDRAVEEYGSATAGASLGDILGAAIRKRSGADA